VSGSADRSWTPGDKGATNDEFDIEQ